jgi:hypothetical protein
MGVLLVEFAVNDADEELGEKLVTGVAWGRDERWPGIGENT